jgi:hypothetical protein
MIIQLTQIKNDKRGFLENKNRDGFINHPDNFSVHMVVIR